MQSRASTWVAGRPRCRKQCGDDDAGRALAEADDEIVGAWSELADGVDAAQEIVERVELFVQYVGDVTGVLAADDFGGGIEVALAKLHGEGECLVALAVTGGGRGGKKLVRDPGHGGDDDHGLEAALAPAR